MRQYQTPLFTGLLKHIERQPLQFHIPGHKKGAGVPDEFRRFVGDNILSMDLINIAPLDDLHNPHGIIQEAQEIAAEAFGADHTFFSVQGTSSAIQAMILAAISPGDKIAVPRNSHKSTISALIWSGARPVFMQPEMDYRLGIAHGISYDTVKRTIDEHPDLKAVLVINPTYYGVAGDLKQMVNLCHGKGIPVLVDEAHGCHTYFHDELPLSAMHAGADLAATSVHKLGGSLTQTSILNMREGLVHPGRVLTILGMLYSTSTSYPLMASLDCARKQLATQGNERIDKAIKLANWARQEINHIPGLYCFGEDIMGGSSARFDHDPTKLFINVTALGVTGLDMENMLREEFNIEVELSDLYNILCFITLGDQKEQVELLLAALRSLAGRFYATRPANQVKIKTFPVHELAMNPRDAFYAPFESVPLREAAGRIAAELIMVYPPGIPILVPGERVTYETLDYVYEHIEALLPVQGPQDKSMRTFKVVKEG